MLFSIFEGMLERERRLFDYKTRYKSVKERNIRKWLLKNIDDEKKTLITRFAYETSIDEFYESEKKKKMSRFTRMIHRYPHA